MKDAESNLSPMQLSPGQEAPAKLWRGQTWFVSLYLRYQRAREVLLWPGWHCWLQCKLLEPFNNLSSKCVVPWLLSTYLAVPKWVTYQVPPWLPSLPYRNGHFTVLFCFGFKFLMLCHEGSFMWCIDTTSNISLNSSVSPLINSVTWGSLPTLFEALLFLGKSNNVHLRGGTCALFCCHTLQPSLISLLPWLCIEYYQWVDCTKS